MGGAGFFPFGVGGGGGVGAILCDLVFIPVGLFTVAVGGGGGGLLLAFLLPERELMCSVLKGYKK